MRDYIVFGGVSSVDCGALIFPKEIDNAPKRNIEKIQIPGRNGSFIIDNGRYEDAEQSYSGVIYDDEKFDEYMNVMRSIVLGEAGYKRLEDTFKPGEYRMAYIDEDFSPNVIRLWRKIGKFELKFTCKPQRYLKIGENIIKLTGTGKLYNPSNFNSQPMLRIFGYGRLNIGNYQIDVSRSNLSYIDIDCERMDAYSNNINCNNLISIESGFPILEAGITEITFSNTITQLQITPRWWCL